MSDRKYKIGDHVSHTKFGYGRVNQVEGNRVTVDFDTGVQKKIIDSFLSIAAFGCSSFRPTFDHVACRIESVDVTEWADDTSLVLVNAASVRAPLRKFQYEFVMDNHDAVLRSPRLEALLRAVHIPASGCGCYYAIKDTDELVGRHFAVKNNGSSAEDFDTLEYMAACRQSDIDTYRRSLAYAAQCAAEEEADVAMARYLETGIEAFARVAQRAA